MDFYDNILLEIKNQIALITLNRPDKLNTLTPEMEHELFLALDTLEEKDDVRVVILTGAGKAFSAGQDISGFESDPGKLRKSLRDLKRPRLLFFGKPVIAAVNGVAMGAGADYVLMCDLVVASDKARFSFPGSKLGIVCPYAFIRLAEETGRTRAKELLMTGRFFDAREAYELRLINKIVPPEKLIEEAFALAREIAHASPLAIKAIKESVNQSLNGFEYSYETMVELMLSGDRIEGTNAFLEKRTPEFKGK